MIVGDIFTFLAQMDLITFVKMFWFFILFDIGRYSLAIIPVLFGAVIERLEPKKKNNDYKKYSNQVTILLAGHNEGDCLKSSVLSLREQTVKGLKIIVVDDGSTDNMADVAHELQRDGLIHTSLRAGIRGGKASALNLGLGHCDREFILSMDIDTSLDRDAVERMLEKMNDDSVGAVSGNIAVRNKYASLMTRFQAVEYLDSISVGRRFSSLMDILGIVSGAFGLFRRDAILQVGGWEVGPGDDSDLTNRLRRAGWKIRFAHKAMALTDVPVTFLAYVKQRLRWNRSIIRVRARKFGVNFNPFSPMFSISNLISVVNIIYFQAVSSLMFYIYLFWTIWYFSDHAILILMITSVIYLTESTLIFIFTCFLYPEREPLKLGVYIFGQSLFNTYVMRAVRLYAYFDEIIFRNSYNDSFYPSKVRYQVEKF